ncbi:hypothetical protein ACFKHW_00195 [Bradyrhizobium lupini]|uniref:hypothetical protein n=1 Tax=Rhizobium lupini TaxID=136996 RepID=UPI00366EA886
MMPWSSENEITLDHAEKWAVYSYKKDFYFYVDTDGAVSGGREGVEQKFSLLMKCKTAR